MRVRSDLISLVLASSLLAGCSAVSTTRAVTVTAKAVPPNLSSVQLNRLMKHGKQFTDRILRGEIQNCAGVNLTSAAIAAHPIGVTLFYHSKLLANARLTRSPVFQFIISGLRTGHGSNPNVGAVPFVIRTSSGLTGTVSLGGGFGEVDTQLRPKQAECS